MSTMTEKQEAFRTDLIARTLTNAATQIEARTGTARDLIQTVANAAIAITLPAPATMADASAQIDALKSGNLMGYAARDKDAYRPMFAAIQTGITSAASIDTDAVQIGTMTPADGGAPVAKMGQRITAASLRRTIERVIA